MSNLFQELKRRNVFRVAIAYLVVAWLLLQVVDLVLDNISAPGWIMQVFMLAIAVGFPIAVIFAWAFEVTPEGVKREKDVDRGISITTQTGRKLDRIIIGVLVVAVAMLLGDRLVSRDSVVEPLAKPTPATRSAIEKSVAVLPFVTMSSGADDGYFSDGLTEEILNSLAQLPDLLVTARTSSFHFKDKDLPIQQIAETLGVAHIVEGSVRRNGDQVRITAQLIRASDGFHLWSETYDRSVSGGFIVQTEIAEKVASALDIVLDDGQLAMMTGAGIQNPEAFVAYQKGMEWFNKGHSGNDQMGNLATANVWFEKAIALAPNFSDAYLRHSDYFTHALLPLESAAGGTAVTVDPATAMASLESDLNAAEQYARDEGRKLNAAFDRALITGRWRGISDLIQRVSAIDDCPVPMWLNTLAIPFGLAEVAHADYARNVACDPLSTDFTEYVDGFVWLGNPDDGVQAATEFRKQGDAQLIMGNLVQALVAAGRFAEAEVIVERDMSSNKQVDRLRIMLAASRGNAEEVQRRFSEFQAAEVGELRSLALASQTGNRELANLIAREFDSRPAGHLSLLINIMVCMCGAPFDLEATPIFAQKLADSGLEWPPSSPVVWPLKDW
ncbi:MAG: hypothetical protein OEW73_09560 [Gammaproteobacteria bacterium]|nr:hypothetical protein [Gammaproteobacteria bacterium]MDH5241018.1 hypothetical protein [Gammaproteobacteria bacterium]MDH5262515.1 hypothetical protein [Gammaproteobacteria bacterium]MDH5583991.1 hypothetical protein [Gammaproteobacteria bacterium]